LAGLNTILMEVKDRIISKSTFLAGLQCPKYLWYLVNDKTRIPEPTQRIQFIFDQGHLIGEYAKKLFPEGVEIGYKGDFEENLERTASALNLRKPIFEAGIISEGKYCKLYSRADILVPSESDMWDIVEAKSSTGIKEINLYDVAFQRYCLEKAGLNIRKCYLIYINNQYIKNGEVNPGQLFTKTDVTAEASELSVEIEKNVLQILKIITNDNCPPEINIGRHCENPFNCPLKESCWSILPENSVFDLYAGMDKAINLFNDSRITLIKDIPDNFSLNIKQKIQVECVKNSSIRVEREAISKFLEKFKYPLYFLDFETFATAIPLFDGTKPYQNVPFQFSLHVLRNSNNEPEHYSFLYDGKNDPRPEFIKALKTNIGSDGSIVVYYELFEKGILRELAEAFPGYSDWINSIIGRIVDLYEPFGKFHYYHYKQKGSASLKKVLPALTEKSYDNMEISNGELASISFLTASGLLKKLAPDKFSNLKSTNHISDEEVIRIRKCLEEYCKLDTEGLIHILKELEKIVKM
jgi:hypothetical protein